MEMLGKIKKNKELKGKGREKGKKRGAGVIIGLIIVAIMINAMQVSRAYSAALTPENHQYPIYSLVTLKLNGETRDNITASLKIFNETSGEWQLNTLLLELIERDLEALPEQVLDLKEAVIYDYNDSSVPGSVYILLSAVKYALTGVVCNRTITYVLSHRDIWWYVEDFSFLVVDLEIFSHINSLFNFDSPLNGTFSLSFDTLVPIRPITYDNGTTDYIILPDTYSIVNNTIIIHYKERNGIQASLYVYNGTAWVVNRLFIKLLNDTFTFLDGLYLFRQNNITLETYGTDEKSIKRLDDALNLLSTDPITGEHYNLTPVFTSDTTKADIAAMLGLGTYHLSLSYSHNYSVTYQFHHYQEFKSDWPRLLDNFITVYFLLSHLWFVERVNWSYYAAETAPNSSFLSFTPPFLLFSFLLMLVLLRFSSLSRSRSRHLKL